MQSLTFITFMVFEKIAVLNVFVPNTDHYIDWHISCESIIKCLPYPSFRIKSTWIHGREKNRRVSL